MSLLANSSACLVMLAKHVLFFRKEKEKGEKKQYKRTNNKQITVQGKKRF
jgi:hypothetical protein